MRESDIEDYLKRRVVFRGGEVRKLKWIGHNGAPDRLVVLPRGRIYFIELKAPGKKTRVNQDRELHKLRLLGCRAFKIDSYEEVDALLDPT